MTLRSHLVTLVLAVLVPMLVFAVIVVGLFGRQQRAGVEQGAVETARALMNAVDESLNTSVKTLEALAVSRALDGGGSLAELHGEARRILRSRPEWLAISLFSPDGRQLLHTGRGPGEPLPASAEPGSLAAVVASRRPVIGDVARSAVSGRALVRVRVPVMRSGDLVYVLSASVEPASLLDVLRRQRIPDDWVLSAFDRNKTIAVRTRSFEQFVGRSVSPEFVRLLDQAGAEGWAETHTLEGTPVYSAFARSPVTGWGVGIGIPSSSVDAPLRRSLLTLAGGGLVLLLVAVLLAALVGRRITTPMASLSSAARAFGEDGGLPASAAAGVDEVEDVRRAFVEAATLVQQRAAEAESANRAKDEFLAVLSHELRTPLNAVYGWARMLRAGELDPAASARALDVIVRQSNAQVQLIDDLLDVSRVITGKMRLDVRSLDPRAVIEGALDAVRPAASAKDIGLHVTLDPRVGHVTADPGRLQQVVWNLVMNAVKFTPRGGRVDVRLERRDAHVEIRVSDTGRGIEPAMLPYIFDRFRQADSSSTRAHAGLGLGLALVRHLVELHGGTVSVHSDGKDTGATFVVALPLGGSEPPAGRAVPPSPATAVPAALRGTAALHGVRVLLVDDDADALDLGTSILAGAGAELRACRSVTEALETFRQWPPDVIVSDIEMPGEDGYALIRAIRDLGADAGGRTPAVALTAYGRAQDRTLALTAGFNMHVPKPIDPAELTDIVAALAARAAGEERAGV
jgi:signal transduction histidine kinase/ActR/RegA family two-component response regulator